MIQAGVCLPPSVANTSTAQARQSLARIEQLTPRILYFGHGAPSTASAPGGIAQARARS